LPSSLSSRRRLPRRLLFLLSCLFPFLAPAQAPPTFDMAVRVLAPVASPGGRPFSHDVVVDAAGNSYVSGQSFGTVHFGSTTINASVSDLYVAKLDAAGNYRWIVSFSSGSGSSNSDFFPALALDASGNVYVAGSFVSPTLTLGSITLTNAGGTDLFVAKLDPNGQWLSAVRAGGTGTENVNSLTLDSAGNIYLTGQFTGSSPFGSTTLRSAGLNDFFVARLDAGGSWRWAVRGGGSVDTYLTTYDWSSDVSVDAHGYVYITGHVVGGGQLGSFTFPGRTSFVARLDAATGDFLRVTPLGAGGLYFNFATLAVAANGDCYIAGSYVGSISFGSTTLTSIGAGIGGEDVFVAKLAANGSWQWANTAGTAYGEHSTGIAVDAHHNVYLTGDFQSINTPFGSIILTSQNPPISFRDVFVAKLSPAGQWLWAVPAGGEKDDSSTGLVLGPAATPYIVGEHVSPTMSFGPLTVPGEPVHAISTFLARMQPNELTITGDSVLCSGSSTQLTASTFAFASTISFRWSTGASTASISVSQPGTYSVTATFSNGYTLSQQFQVRSISPSVQISGGGGFLCPGSPRQLTALAPGATSLRWSTGATTPSISVSQPGTYSVVASYSPACSVTASTSIASNEVRISGRLQLCPGQSTTLTASTSGSAATGYLWNTGATSPTLLVSQAGTFRVTAFFADGCQLSTSHTVGPPVAKVASVSGDTLLCPNTTLALTALNPDAINYEWNTGASTPGISVSQPGLYRVVLTYTGGCTSRDSLLVRPAPVAPVFSLGADTTLCLEQPLRLQAPAFSGPGVSWRWSDGSSGPSLLVTEPGTYSLLVTTLCDSRRVSRRVDYASCLFIPNIITPNEDQRNDRFVIQGLTHGDWDLTLYNRWGRQVYHSPAYAHDWGADAAPGQYFYLLRQPATKLSYKGQLEVVR
jgi:hypothetical protein